MISAERLRERLTCDPEAGIFHWRATSGNVKGGSIAGSSFKSGRYRIGRHRIKIDSIQYFTHRLVWLYVHGEWPPKYIDHIDGNPANNSIHNLRVASTRQNNQNNRSKGYGFHRASTKYRARITVDGKLIELCYCHTPEEARAAYLAASAHYFGEFSAVHSRPHLKNTCAATVSRASVEQSNCTPAHPHPVRVAMLRGGL